MSIRLRQLYEYAIKYAVEHYLPWTYKDCYRNAYSMYRVERRYMQTVDYIDNWYIDNLFIYLVEYVIYISHAGPS